MISTTIFLPSNLSIRSLDKISTPAAAKDQIISASLAASYLCSFSGAKIPLISVAFSPASSVTSLARFFINSSFDLSQVSTKIVFNPSLAANMAAILATGPAP